LSPAFLKKEHKMFIVSKLFNWLFLSPLLFIVLVLAGWLLGRKHKRTGGAVILCAITLLYLLAIRPVKNLIVHPLEFRYANKAVTKVNYLLVAGGGIVDRSPEFNRPVLTESSLRRCLTAYRWWKFNKCPIVLCGGSPLKNGHPEAQVMADFLADLGVPKKDLKIEPYSRNTYENIHNAKKLLKLKRTDKVGVITSAVHLPRTIAICRKFKLNYLAVPSGYVTELTPYHWYDYFPSAFELNQTFSALHEYVGVVYYKFRYRV